MAPNSIIQFPVGLDNQEMVPGEYKAHVLATSGGSKWEWTEPFSISQIQADKFNKEAVDLVQSNGLDWKLVLYIVLGILSLIALLFWGVSLGSKQSKRKKRKRKSSQE